MISNERNTFDGEEVRQEEHDILPEMRKKDLQPEQGYLLFMRFWKELKAEKIRVAEESKVILDFLLILK